MGARCSSSAKLPPHFFDHILKIGLGSASFTDESIQIVRARRGGERRGGGSDRRGGGLILRLRR